MQKHNNIKNGEMKYSWIFGVDGGICSSGTLEGGACQFPHAGDAGMEMGQLDGYQF